ncbi:hypothetical protein ACFL5A_04735 [Gemmatimonadota bacterium]
MKDLEHRVPLEPLDPGSSDSGFWVRFHATVMDRARLELARRQVNGDLSIAEVVFAWRRALVPIALLAAALAGVLLISQEEPLSPLPPVALEEVLMQDLSAEAMPAVLGSQAELDETAFLAMAGRF